MDKDSELSLIWDRKQPDLILAGRALYLRPKTHQPYRPDAIVVEQDRWLVLGEQTRLKQDERPAWIQANELEDTPEYEPGSVIPRAGQPTKLLAILYDLGQQPSSQPDWIEGALLQLLQYCDQQGLARLQLPVLGYQHGGVSLEQFAERLRSVLGSFTPTNPTTLLIALSEHSLRQPLLARLSQ